LQDYGRALIVGDSSTHGKGTVQKLEPLRPYVWPATATATNDPGTLKITKGKFYRVTGASTQLKGVISDIMLPDELSYSTLIGESSLDNALPWDTIQAVDYQKFNMVQPYLAELQSRSQARLSTNQDYLYIKQDIDEFLKLQADRTVTLNEHEAISERETNTLRAEARDKERNGRVAPDVKIYELTVENADNPGLPAPMGATNEVAKVVVNPMPQQPVSMGKDAAPAIQKYMPPVDPTLDETERIMLDYISLMHKVKDNNTQIANQSRL
jgi:carboxyl-terminal processing protease